MCSTFDGSRHIKLQLLPSCTCHMSAGGEAVSASSAAPSTAGLDQQPPAAGFGGGDDAGFSSGMGAQQPAGGFGDDAESFRWDTGSGAGGGESGGWGFGGGDGGGGDEESASGLWGLLVGIWAMIFGE
jgi:hypothetical protein